MVAKRISVVAAEIVRDTILLVSTCPDHRGDIEGSPMAESELVKQPPCRRTHYMRLKAPAYCRKMHTSHRCGNRASVVTTCHTHQSRESLAT